MDLKKFLSLIPKIQQLSLGGTQTHLEMVPSERQKQLDALQALKKEWQSAAVMICCYPDKNGILGFPLIKRPAYSGVHSSQIALPGGKVEASDASLWDTAARELKEELGIETNKETFVRQLTPLHIPPSGFLVTPFVGVLQEAPQLETDPREVAAVIPMQVDALRRLNPSENLVTTNYSQEVKVPGYAFKGEWIWGATAMILEEFKALLKAVI